MGVHLLIRVLSLEKYVYGMKEIALLEYTEKIYFAGVTIANHSWCISVA